MKTANTGREREAEFDLYYYRSRYYDPLTGRFMTRDPLGFAAGDVNLYRYVGNNPVSYVDPFGLFGEGLRAGGDYPGHSDFYGNDLFWYNAEDVDPRTSPWNYRGGGTARHFRNITDVERNLIDAINAGNINCMQRLLHQGQDYFTHYSKGFRAEGKIVINNFGIIFIDLPGHLEAGNEPDQDYEAWIRANAWTMYWVNIWLESHGR